MSQKYIDVKVTVWNRYHLSDDADVPAIIEDLQSGYSVDEALEKQGLFDEPGFEYETLTETEEMMDLADNDGQSTIEVYDQTINEFDVVYTNEVKHLIK